MFLRKKAIKFSFCLLLLTFLNQFANFLRAYYRDSGFSDSSVKSAIWLLRREHLFRQIDEGFYFELEFKLKFIYENFEHRMDFVESSAEQMLMRYQLEPLRHIVNKFNTATNIEVRRRLL